MAAIRRSWGGPQVLQGLLNKSLLLEKVVGEIEECLKQRDTFASDMGLSSPVNGDAPPLTDTRAQTNSRSHNSGADASNGLRLDKRQIEQRIEEDRERHKRMRESMWTVPSQSTEEAIKLCDETSDTGDDDRVLGREELEGLRHESPAVPCRHRLRNGAHDTPSR